MYLFPSDNIPSSEKDEKDFGLNVLRAIDVAASGGLLNRGMHPQMTLRELYSEGNQPIEQYKGFLLSGNDSIAEEGRKDLINGKDAFTSYTNINWRILSPMPKLVSVFRSMMSSRDYRVEVKSLVRSHINKKAERKWRLYTKSKLTNPLREELGLPTNKVGFNPADQKELELAENVGYFKLGLETTLEKIIEHSFEISDWDRLRVNFQKNTFDHRFRMAKVESHPTSGAACFRWIDPKKSVIQWNPDNLGEKPLYVGYYESIQVKELAEILLNEGYSNDEVEAQLRAAVVSINKTADFNKMNGSVPDWYKYRVDVLHAEYISTNFDAHYAGKNKDGKRVVTKAKYDKEGNLKENKYEDGETLMVSRNFLYEGSYILGTQFVYNWGKCPHQVRDKKNNVMYSYVWHYLSGRSLTERAIGILDDLQMAVLKLRIAVAAAAPKGYDIDLGEAANIVVRGKAVSVFELMKIRRETGANFRRTIKTMTGQKETLAPLQENEGGIGKQMNEWFAMIQMNIGLLFDELGIPMAIAGQGLQSDEKAVGVLLQEVNGAINTTFDESEADKLFKKKLAEVLVMKARIGIRFNNKVENYYEGLFGEKAIKEIKSIEGLTLEELGISMKPRPTEAEKAQLMQDCIELSKASRDGFLPFTQADVVIVRQMLANDEMELASIYMAKTVETNTKKHQEAQMAAIEANTKAQIESAQAATQNEMALIQAKAQSEVMVLSEKIKLEGAIKEKLLAQKQVGEMEQIKTEIAAEKEIGTNIRNPRD